MKIVDEDGNWVKAYRFFGITLHELFVWGNKSYNLHVPVRGGTKNFYGNTVFNTIYRWLTNQSG